MKGGVRSVSENREVTIEKSRLWDFIVHFFKELET